MTAPASDELLQSRGHDEGFAAGVESRDVRRENDFVPAL